MQGEILAILAAFLWGISATIDKIAISDGNIPIPQANLIRSIGSLSSLAIIVFLLRDYDFSAFDSKRISLLLIAGSIAGGVAMILFYFALRQIGAGRTVPLSSIYPLFTVILAILFLGENITIKVIAGTLLIIGGVILVLEG